MNRLSCKGAIFLAGVVVLAILAATLQTTPRPSAAAAAGGTAALSTGTDEHPKPTVSSTPPQDVEIPQDFPKMKSQIAFFDDFSWRTFLALCWPAVKDKRGEADQTKKPGAPAPAVVWGTWKATAEVFLPDGKAPGSWDSYYGLSPNGELNADAGRVRQLTAVSRFGTVLSDNEKFGFGNPVGVLVAQNQTIVRFEMRLNRIQFEHICGKPGQPKTALYLAKNLPKQGGPPVRFPTGSQVVKAAWREFTPMEEELKSKYYCVDALLVDPVTKKGVRKTVGLVALHIACKTESRPQWIWSTFRPCG